MVNVLDTVKETVTTQPEIEKTCVPNSTVIIHFQLKDDIYNLVYTRTQLLEISELVIKLKQQFQIPAFNDYAELFFYMQTE